MEALRLRPGFAPAEKIYAFSVTPDSPSSNLEPVRWRHDVRSGPPKGLFFAGSGLECGYEARRCTRQSAILPANSGCALFVGNDEKVFVINVEPQMGAVIGMFLRDTPKERPLTHDLINRIFQGFGIIVERVVITD